MEQLALSTRFRSAALSLLVLLVIQFLPSLGLLANRTATTPLVPAVLVFGDSIVDPGNNNGLNTIIKCNFPPYGIDFPGHKPTGRFCNGRIASDFIASKLGVKEYLPAYLGTEGPEILTGVSFASSGTGYDPLTPKLVSVMSMKDEVGLFKEYMGKVKAMAGEQRAETILSGSLYVLCAGTDDLANTYFTTHYRRAYYSIPAYVNLLVNNAVSIVEELIDLGARKIGFVGLPPVGCVPSQRTLGGDPERRCDPTRNQAALLYNSRMNGVLKMLQNRYEGTKIVFLDIYDILLDLILQPASYGFEVSTKGCCGTGELEVAILCNEFTPVTCPDTTKYLFWDSYHPTERGYKILIDKILERHLKLLI